MEAHLKAFLLGSAASPTVLKRCLVETCLMSSTYLAPPPINVKWKDLVFSRARVGPSTPTEYGKVRFGFC